MASGERRAEGAAPQQGRQEQCQLFQVTLLRALPPTALWLMQDGHKAHLLQLVRAFGRGSLDLILDVLCRARPRPRCDEPPRESESTTPSSRPFTFVSRSPMTARSCLSAIRRSSDDL